MDTAASKFLFLFSLSSILLIVCSSGSLLSGLKDFVQKELIKTEKQTLHSYRRELIQTIQHDFMNPPITTFPPTPVTNPVTTPVTNPVTTPTPATGIGPPDTSTPPLIAIPSSNPVPTTPTTPVTTPPATDPINPPTPVTNPVTTPSTTIPGGQPGTNPVTTPGTTTPGGQPATNPVVAPPAIINAPTVPGQSWCVAAGGAPETALQTALDYACGIGGVDCSAIQQGASCYNPNSLQNHASYAFNSYYQRNPVQTSCDFGGTAMITNVNPSSGSCVFTTWSSSSASPTTTSPTTTAPTTPTPTMESSSGATTPGLGTPPNILNASNPALGGGMTGYGESPLTSTTPSASTSSSLQPFIGCIVLAISIITGRMVLNI